MSWLGHHSQRRATTKERRQLDTIAFISVAGRSVVVPARRNRTRPTQRKASRQPHNRPFAIMSSENQQCRIADLQQEREELFRRIVSLVNLPGMAEEEYLPITDVHQLQADVTTMQALLSSAEEGTHRPPQAAEVRFAVEKELEGAPRKRLLAEFLGKHADDTDYSEMTTSAAWEKALQTKVASIQGMAIKRIKEWLTCEEERFLVAKQHQVPRVEQLLAALLSDEPFCSLRNTSSNSEAIGQIVSLAKSIWGKITARARPSSASPCASTYARVVQALGYTPDDKRALETLAEFRELFVLVDRIRKLDMHCGSDFSIVHAHFNQPFIGTGAADLLRFVLLVVENHRRHDYWYACYFAFVQSSGYGKSRTLCELPFLKDTFYVIFVCFRKPGSTGYPPLLSWVDGFLAQLRSACKCGEAKKVWSDFVMTVITLVHENSWTPMELHYALQQDTLPAIQGKLLSEEEISAYFPKETCTFLLALDEASALLPKYNEDVEKSMFQSWRLMLIDMWKVVDLVGVVADTDFRVANFAPPQRPDPTHRIRGGKSLYPPHYLVPIGVVPGLETIKLPPFDKYGTGDSYQLCLAYMQVRPLFFGVMDIMSAKWKAGTDYARPLATAFRMAIEKLLPHVFDQTPEQKATSYAACICARTSTPIMSTSFASDAVAYHLGTLLYVSDARDRMTVLYPPEPPVSAAATAILKYHGDVKKRISTYKSALSSFRDVLYDKLPLAGPMGELVQELRMLDGIDDARIEYIMDNPDLYRKRLAEQLGLAVPVRYVVKHWFPRIYDRVLDEMDPELARGKILVTKFARVHASMSELRRFDQDFFEGCLLSHMAITLVGKFPMIDLVIPVRLEDKVTADAPDTAGGEPCTPGDPTFRPRIALIQVQVKNQADLLDRAECVAYISRLKRQETASNAFDMLNNLALTRLPRATRIKNKQAVPPATPGGRLKAGKARGGAGARSKRSDAASTADNARQNVAFPVQGLPPSSQRQTADSCGIPSMSSDEKSLAEVEARSAAVAWSTPDNELIPTFFIVSQLAHGVRNDAEGRLRQIRSAQEELGSLKSLVRSHRDMMDTAFGRFQERELEIAGTSAAPKARAIEVTDEQHKALFERSLSPACDTQLAELKDQHATLYGELLDIQTFIERSKHAMDDYLQALNRPQEQASLRVKAATESAASSGDKRSTSSSSMTVASTGGDECAMRAADADAAERVCRPPPPMSGHDQTLRGLRLRDVTFSDVMRRECKARSKKYDPAQYARGVFVFNEDGLACGDLGRSSRPRGIHSEVAEQYFAMLKLVRVEPTDGVVREMSTGTFSLTDGLLPDESDLSLAAAKYCSRLAAGKPRSMHPLERFFMILRRVSSAAMVCTVRSLEVVNVPAIQEINVCGELSFVDDGVYIRSMCNVY